MRRLEEIELQQGGELAKSARSHAQHGRRACAFVCSLLVRPVRKLFPFRATNCAVSLTTSRSKAVMPSGSGMENCSFSGASSTMGLKLVASWTATLAGASFAALG